MQTEIAVLGGGCFWCTEAVFEGLRGVVAVKSGYAGGAMSKPTYEAVSGGQTGHAEVIKIEFDSTQITFRDLLTVFFATHDATTRNRQGNDIGTQYRSIILYTRPAGIASRLAAMTLEKVTGNLRFPDTIKAWPSRKLGTIPTILTTTSSFPSNTAKPC